MKIALVSIGSGGRYGGLSRQLLSLPTLEAYAVAHDPLIARRCSFVHLSYDADAFDAGQAAAEILAVEPDLVGFGCYIWSTAPALAAARLVRQRRPAVRIVCGGPNATALHEEILLDGDAVDVVVLGEGEETFKELLARQLAGEAPDASCRGIAWREGGVVRRSVPRPLIADMAALVSPFLTGRYRIESGCCIETLRGCPFDCSYCVWGETSTRFLPLERVLAELDLLNRAEVRTVVFVDSIFNLDQERAHRILEHLIAVEFKPWIMIEMHPRLADERTLELLARIRRAYVALGVQSINPRALAASGRRQEAEHARRVVERLRRPGDQGPCVALQYVMGLPEDDLEGFVATTDWVFATTPGSVGAFHLSVVPGSRLHGDAQRLGLVYDRERRYRLISSPSMSAADVRTAAAMLAWVQRWPGIFHRLSRFSGRPAGGLVLEWVRQLAAGGLIGAGPAGGSLEREPADMERLLVEFQRFVRGLAIAPDPEGIAARCGALLLYTMARLHAVAPRWHYREALDVTGIRYADCGRVAAPWATAPDGAAPRGPLRFAAPLVTLWFEQDPAQLMAARDTGELLAVKQGAHYLIFFHPGHAAARACLVDAAGAEVVRALEQGVAVAALDERGRRIAAALVGIGAATAAAEAEADPKAWTAA